MTSTNKTFSERLKQARQKKSYTQSDMANKLQVTQGAYQKWESGVRDPNLETIVKITKILDIDTDYLLGRTDYPRQDWHPLDIFDVSDIKNFDKEKRDKLKFSIMFEITRNKIKALELKNNLITEHNLDKTSKHILDTIFKEVAIEIKDYYGL